MRRPRWPDAILVLGTVGLLALGVWALWGDDLRDWLWPKEKVQQSVPAGTAT
jgi:hypothetical protein